MFFGPTRLKITPQQEMKRKNRESKENGRRRREKSNGCTLSLHCGYFGTSILVQSFSQEFIGKTSYSSALYQFCQKTVSVIEVWCCGIGYLLRCGKRELSPPLNPVAANPFLSMDNNWSHNARHSWKAGTHQLLQLSSVKDCYQHQLINS